MCLVIVGNKFSVCVHAHACVHTSLCAGSLSNVEWWFHPLTTWSCVFVKFAKVRYFNRKQVRLWSLFSPAPLSNFLSGAFTGYIVYMAWDYRGIHILVMTSRAVAQQAPLSMGFSRQEYWSGLPCPSPWIFPTQRSKLHLLHCRQILYCRAIREAPYVKNIDCIKL